MSKTYISAVKGAEFISAVAYRFGNDRVGDYYRDLVPELLWWEQSTAETAVGVVRKAVAEVGETYAADLCDAALANGLSDAYLTEKVETAEKAYADAERLNLPFAKWQMDAIDRADLYRAIIGLMDF